MATEDGDLFREMKARKKERTLQTQELNMRVITEYCTAYKIPFRSITDYQVRVNDIIDIFTQSKKYHHISKNKRGIIKGRITDFLKSQL